MKTQLTSEESSKLIELGVSPQRASNMWVKSSSRSYTCERNHLLIDALIWKTDNDSNSVNYGFIFTLADILGLLPKFIPDAVGVFSYALKIQPCNLPGWQVCYYAYSLDKGKGYRSSPELIDALHLLLLWCLEKGHVK